MRLLHCVFLGLAVACSVAGQTYTISTYAGGLPVNIAGTSANLREVCGVAVDGEGNVFFAQESIVLRLDAITGILTLVAGNGTPGFSGDNGPATSAQLGLGATVAVDSTGNLYITNGGRIRKVSGGVITTVAGGGSLLDDNVPATSAQLYPTGIAVDSAGDLYIADGYFKRIRKVSDGVITTVAGGGSLLDDNVPATSAQLPGPTGVAVDSAGNLYISDAINHRVRKVSGGVITTVAGNGTIGFGGDDGPATSAQLSYPFGVAVDSAGNLYIRDDNRIRKVSDGVITTVAGDGTSGFSGDNGPATSAQLNLTADVVNDFGSIAVDSAGNLYIADLRNGRIRKVSDGVITTVAGGDSSLGDDGPAVNARLQFDGGDVLDDGQYGYAGDVAVDSLGNLYIAETLRGRVRKVSGGVITTVAGGGSWGSLLDDNVPATSGWLYPRGVAVDSAGNLYIADTFNQRVRKVSGGVISTVAGNGKSGFSGDDGPATSARLEYPTGVAVDTAGNLYIADTINHRIRKVAEGVITTVAGGGSLLDDNVPATSAQLSGPAAVAVDFGGNLYIADGRRIRKVSNGVITTVAGNGTSGFSGDNGPATSAQLMGGGVAVDATGNLYIADAYNYRIRKVSDGVITTVAGNGTYGFSGDGGPAINAQLSGPMGITVDSAGNIYVADTGSNRVRLLQPQPPSRAEASPMRPAIAPHQ